MGLGRLLASGVKRKIRSSTTSNITRETPETQEHPAQPSLPLPQQTTVVVMLAPMAGRTPHPDKCSAVIAISREVEKTVL